MERAAAASCRPIKSFSSTLSPALAGPFFVGIEPSFIVHLQKRLTEQHTSLADLSLQDRASSSVLSNILHESADNSQRSERASIVTKVSLKRLCLEAKPCFLWILLLNPG
jgi:hypothetical protein